MIFDLSTHNLSKPFFILEFRCLRRILTAFQRRSVKSAAANDDCLDLNTISYNFLTASGTPSN